MTSQNVIDSRSQLLWAEWFFYVVVGASGKAVGDIVFLRTGGEQDDRYRLQLCIVAY